MTGDTDSSNDNYRDQLAAAYLKRAGSFRKLLTGLLGFTAAFGFFIAWPYLAAVRQEAALTVELQRLDTELAQGKTRLQQLKRPQQAMQQLQRLINDGPPMLRAYIEATSRDLPFPYPDSDPACEALRDPDTPQGGLPLPAPGSPSQLPLPGPSPLQAPVQQRQPLPGRSAPDRCALQQGRARLACRIDRFVQFQLCEYEQGFRHRVLPALAALQDGGGALFAPHELDRQFATLREALHRQVAGQPDFWHTYAEKGRMGVRLQQAVEERWQAMAGRITPLVAELDRRITGQHQRRKTLQADNAALLQQRKELAARLTRIRSPIGNLPIGLTESVLLFPIVLAIGFAMACAGLLEQLRLRHALRRAERQIDDNDKVLRSAQLAELAPLWIEPGMATLPRLARWSLLLVPLAAFAGTVWAIRSNAAALLAQAATDGRIYALLYAAGALAGIACLWLIGRGVRRLAVE